MDIFPHIGKRLKKINVDFGREWSLWEYKTFNIHRAIVHWNAPNLQPTMEDIQKKHSSLD